MTRRRHLLCLAVLLSFWVLPHSWPCCNRGAVAVRIFQPNLGVRERVETIIGRRPVPPSFSSSVPAVPFDESKRRVPSCPDPLHNRRNVTWRRFLCLGYRVWF